MSMIKSCSHKFVWIRQEETENGGFRPTVDIFDVFFCEKCLRYEKKLVAKSEHIGGGSGYVRRSIL